MPIGVALKMGKVAVQVSLFLHNWNNYVPHSFFHIPCKYLGIEKA